MKNLKLTLFTLIFILSFFVVTSVNAGQTIDSSTPIYNDTILFAIAAAIAIAIKFTSYKIKKVTKQIEEFTGEKL
jgi:uncharacterized membrane protein YcaP (DUF421 family)